MGEWIAQELTSYDWNTGDESDGLGGDQVNLKFLYVFVMI